MPRALLAALALTACSEPVAAGLDAAGDSAAVTFDAPADAPSRTYPTPRPRGDAGADPYGPDDTLRLNDVQARGTHNSYHVANANPIDPSHRYTHDPLDVQLERWGVRQFELDVHYRPGVGFEVFHLPTLDEESTCRRFVDCLGVIRTWSDAHPWHMPLMIWIEPKDDIDRLDRRFAPIAGHYEELDAEILSVWPRSLVLTPDDVRQGEPDLPTAVRRHGWPTLGALRGHVVFALLDSGTHRAGYVGASRNLAGRVLFVDASSPDEPWAAMFKIDDAVRDGDEVRRRVDEGFLVTSNTGSAGQTDTDAFEESRATLAAGVHFASTDFPAPRDGGRFWLEIPGGTPARCNPRHADAGCTPTRIERTF